MGTQRWLLCMHVVRHCKRFSLHNRVLKHPTFLISWLVWLAQCTCPLSTPLSPPMRPNHIRFCHTLFELQRSILAIPHPFKRRFWVVEELGDADTDPTEGAQLCGRQFYPTRQLYPSDPRAAAYLYLARFSLSKL